MLRSPRTGAHPSPQRWTPRPAHHLRGGAPRRLLAGLVVAAAGVAGTAGGASPAALAGWTGTAQVSANVSMAKTTQSWSNLNTAGTIGSDGVYIIRGLVVENIGYVDLVNTSTTAATLAATITTATVVGASPAQICSGSWNTTTGFCNGTVTTPGFAAVLGGTTGTYTTPAPVAPGGRISFKVRVLGVASAASFTPLAPAFRPGADRTTS
ncbi:hypothetical protein [Modestobacter sp. SSW1-42]|uniref:hypothetical protein n=1 Tax=Modestobacter sp. SSW1-42 TaxID=596372 RepID=UPI003985BC64